MIERSTFIGWAYPCRLTARATAYGRRAGLRMLPSYDHNLIYCDSVYRLRRVAIARTGCICKGDCKPVKVRFLMEVILP